MMGRPAQGQPCPGLCRFVVFVGPGRIENLHLRRNVKLVVIKGLPCVPVPTQPIVELYIGKVMPDVRILGIAKMASQSTQFSVLRSLKYLAISISSSLTRTITNLPTVGPWPLPCRGETHCVSCYPMTIHRVWLGD